MTQAKPVATSLATTDNLKLQDGYSLADATLYRQTLGLLLNSYYGISSALSIMDLCYVKGPQTLHTFADADCAGDPTDRSSTSTNVIFRGVNPISWSCKKQKTVARSSTEAEYRAIASAARELNWIMNLLQELRVSVPSISVIYCDNIIATYVCTNPVFHSRMKHIAIDFHFVREQVTAKRLRVFHIHTYDQLVDSLIKLLARTQLLNHRNKIGVLNGQSISRGHDKIGKSTGNETLKEFCSSIIELYGEQYWRSPNEHDIHRLLQEGESRGFPGGNNDINVLDHSPLFDNMIHGRMPPGNQLISMSLAARTVSRYDNRMYAVGTRLLRREGVSSRIPPIPAIPSPTRGRYNRRHFSTAEL
ncbi:PREDICTED: uncharacterized protein LOC105954895 [Erythranthe guttata]|uniref:uncharacterized protein LOC105954895 n=1 Tax=Erythranthe guttata TaxID=4155 RepID=UPI00064D97AD|nr:PREDICTED: uncharacterized protein LOC105954895 [Erythranthe guttata]|eukprot:XP_012834033.1 PREDICTED: uncharacterized protein LOC105954895 [Erythranthe guttata]